MTGSIATAPDATLSRPRPSGVETLLRRTRPILIGAGLALLAFLVYWQWHSRSGGFYDHFVWQAQAWLDGRVAIPFPYDDGVFNNAYFQDVYPLPDQPGWALIPFPPLPTIALLPLVALDGLAANQSFVAALFGALAVGLCWWMLIGVTPRRSAALLGTVFYGFGTVAWYAAMLGSTWFLAHVVASAFLFAAIGLAVRADRRRRPREGPLQDGGRPGETGSAMAPAGAPGASSVGGRTVLGLIDPRQFVAGLLFGTAALARLTTIFGAPFFVFVGGGGTWFRRAFSAGLGAVIPVALLLGYNVATTGHVFHPAYEYLYRNEYRPDPTLYHPDWAIEDPRYVPQNIRIMLAWLPETPLLSDRSCTELPESDRPSGLGLLFDRDCPIVRPDPIGMSLLLASPGYLLAIPALLRARRRRLIAGAVLAVGAIALLNLMHFSQGWVQFGYRFSNDFAPFAMIPVALGIARLGVRPLTVAVVALSIAINAWGVYWGLVLGW